MMATVRLWRQISLCLWLSCLLLVVYSAPVNENASAVEVNDQSDDNDLGSAIEAMAKAKRAARKRSSLRSSHGRTHYRFPNQLKRSGGMHDGDDDFEIDGGDNSEDEFNESLAAYLEAEDDNSVDLDELAKEIALNILMEENDKNRENQLSSIPKKKKVAPVAHRARTNNSLDDKRRKRMNSLVNQLLEEREGADDDDYDSQIGEHAETDDNNEANESLASESEEDEEDDELVSRVELRKLFNQGLERREINALLSQLERSRDSEEFKSEKKKRTGSDWRKLPRASLRWRFLHSQGQESNEPSYGRHQSTEEEEPDRQDKSIPFEDRFFGRGFHRVGNIQDEPIRSIPSEAAKRVQHALKTKNAISVIRKRSIASLQNSAENKENGRSALQILRKRRSSPPPTTQSKAEENRTNETSMPLALPLAEPKNRSASQVQQKSSKDAQVHSGVIRKKSVDWDDYFGYDKRSDNKADDEAMTNYLESDYYKTMAGSLAFRRKRVSAEDQRHSGHLSGMKKRYNATASNASDKKKKRFRSMERGAGLDDAEEVLDAAMNVVEERRERNNIDRVREQLVAELVDNLNEEELDQMTERLSEELDKAIRLDDEEEEDDEPDVKRSVVNQQLKNKKKKKKSLLQNDERRKRFAVKRSNRHRSGFNGPEIDDDNDCVIAEQVVTTCNMVSHLYGGYRPVLSDACHRHQACFICSDNEAACDGEFQHRVLALCGPDLLCQSQSRHLLSALGQLDQMEADYLFPLAGQAARIEALCRRDSCLAEYWKGR